MRGLFFSVVLLMLVAGPASATHNADVHSENTSEVASLKLGGLADIAFWGDLAVATQFVFEDGSTDGFSVIDISDPDRPRELKRFVCTGGGWDVSLWEHLAFLSVDNFTPTQDLSCASDPGGTFGGIKIVSIADPRNPQQVGAVEMPCSGSHTNTVFPDLARRRLIVYAISLKYNTDPPQTGCDAIIEVPLDDPASAKVVGALPNDELEGCHDATVFMPRKLLAGACATELRLYDISDPVAPRLSSVLVNPGTVFNHSAAFSNDGNTLVTGEEGLFYSGETAACPGGTRAPTGALWFYDITEPALPVLRSYYQLERGLEPGSPGGAGCSAHNFNVVPTRGDQDILVTAWYSGGLNAIDFTDPASPREIAYYQPALADPARRVHYWAAYWYRGYVYATSSYQTPRHTLDVYRITDPAIDETFRLPHLNPQTQEALADAPAPPPARPKPVAPAPGAACRPGPRAVRVRGARRIVSAELLKGRRRARRLRVSGRTVRVRTSSLAAGTYTLRVAYRDRKGRTRTLRRRVTVC